MKLNKHRLKEITPSPKKEILGRLVGAAFEAACMTEAAEIAAWSPARHELQRRATARSAYSTYRSAGHAVQTVGRGGAIFLWADVVPAVSGEILTFVPTGAYN